MMDQYELASLLSVIISEQYLEYVFNCSLFIIDGFASYVFKSFDLFFKGAKKIKIIQDYSFWFPIINFFSSIGYVNAEYIF